MIPATVPCGVFQFIVAAVLTLLVTACGGRGEAAPSSDTGESITPVRTINKTGAVEGCAPQLYDHGIGQEETTAIYRRCRELQKQVNEAARAGDLDQIQKTLELGANVNGGYYQEGPPLAVAVIALKVEAVRLLVDRGADVNVRGKWEQTPLHLAAFYDSMEITQILVENGADVCSRAIDDRSDKKATPIDIAMGELNHEIVQYLTANGARECP